MSNYPTIRPSLTLDFQKSKQLDPRITFSRSSSATYVEGGVIKYADEHQARFEEEGLLIEESRTNYAENSEDFSLWTAQNSTVLTAQGTAPNGTNTAFKIQENTSNISHSIREPTNSTWSGAATMSCYVKPAGRNFAYMGFTGVSQTSVTFDLVNKVSSYKGNNVTSASVEEAGNGWVRIIAVFSSSITSGRATVGPAESDSVGGLNYTGDGSSGILAWGAQLEAGTFPTSYIPTSGSTVTRSTDIAQITGDNFSSWYNTSESTWYAEGDQITIDSDGNQVGRQSIFVDRYANISPQRWAANSWRGKHNNASIIGVFTTPVTPKGSTVKTTYAVDGTNAKMCVEGVLSSTGTLSTYPQNTELRFGKSDRLVVNDDWKGHISRLTYYPRRLTDSELQTITL